MKRVIISVLLLALLILPMNALAADFSDMPNDWSTEALEKAVENGLLKGANGKIMPNDNLTRAQMATVVNRSFGAYKEASLAGFTDVQASQWYYTEMAKAVNMKTFEGSNNMLNPNDSITREQAFAVMARALKIEPTMEEPTGYADLDQISNWAKGEIYAMIEAGYIQGSNNMVHPKGFITRAEFAKLMDNIIKEYISLPGEYTSVEKGNVMVNTKDVVLKDVVVEGDLIIGDGVAEGDITLENVEVTGRLLVRGGGVDSIKITGSSKIKNIIIARVDGKVRVYFEDGVEIGEVIVDGSEDVILEGDFESLTVLASDVTVFVTNANIKSVLVTGARSKIVVDKESTIDKIVVNANDVTIEGKGKVKEVIANGNNVEVTVIGTKVTAGDNTKGVMAGEKEVLPGKTESVEEEVTRPSSGGGSSTPDVDFKLDSATLKIGTANPVEATIDGNNIIVTLPTSDSEENYEIVANFNKSVTVESVKYVKGTSKLEVADLFVSKVDLNQDDQKQLKATLSKQVTDLHFEIYGDDTDVVVEVIVKEGTRLHTFTITVSKEG